MQLLIERQREMVGKMSKEKFGGESKQQTAGISPEAEQNQTDQGLNLSGPLHFIKSAGEGHCSTFN